MRGWLAWLIIVMGTSVAAGQPAEPWKVGVTDDQRTAAQAQLEQGNALFLDKRYPEALRVYERALEAWNHPAIRFNIVRCLIQLERPVEALEQLDAALAYGAAPLEDTVFREALTYRQLLAKQIAVLDIGCSQPGVRVSLDGRAVPVSCPGRAAQRVRPGGHQLIGVRDGFQTRTLEVKLVGGTREAAEVELVALASASRVTRRWSVWKPWLVFGGGLVLTGLGTSLQLIASSDLDTFDRQIALGCTRTACDPVASPQIASLAASRDRALLENRIAIGAIAVGAATTIAGIVLLYLNRTHTIVEPALAITADSAHVSLGVRL